MVALPQSAEKEITARVYATYEAEEAGRPLYLGRLGASTIGRECLREVWLDWRGFARKGFGGRMLRLFRTGHLQEERIIADLRAAGLEVFDRHPTTDAQFEFVDSTGHLVCKVDGVVKGVPGSGRAHVLEAKTHNKNSFAGFAKRPLREVKPEHYTQVQVGMHLGALERGLYAAVCKDNEEYYFERVRPDAAEVKRVQLRVHTLIDARMRPAPISDDIEKFPCKFCDMRLVCAGKEEPLRHCRTCEHCRPVERGQWKCELADRVMSIEEQRVPCEAYSAL